MVIRHSLEHFKRRHQGRKHFCLSFSLVVHSRTGEHLFGRAKNLSQLLFYPTFRSMYWTSETYLSIFWLENVQVTLTCLQWFINCQAVLLDLKNFSSFEQFVKH